MSQSRNERFLILKTYVGNTTLGKDSGTFSVERNRSSSKLTPLI